jgi:type I restriction enzyme M protein
MFIVKVGNHTGHGIDWKPRERNFISLAEAERRRHGKNQLTLRRGDIVLTSSAHSPRYIAKKVDIVAEIPSFVNGDASFVGEVMRLRVQEGAADPYLLLAFLRAPKTTERLQRMIRGQTAHLMPDDVLDLEVPESVVRGSPKLRALRKLLEREAVLAAELGDVERQRDHMIHQIFENDI